MPRCKLWRTDRAQWQRSGVGHMHVAGILHWVSDMNILSGQWAETWCVYSACHVMLWRSCCSNRKHDNSVCMHVQ